MKKRLAALAAMVLVIGIAAYVFGGRIDWRAVIAGLRDVNPGWMVASVVVTFLTYWVRAVRWQVLLAPIRRVSISRLFEVNLIGFSAIYIWRPLEVLRPVWLNRREGVSITASLATVVAERVLDFLCIIGLFAWAVVSVETSPDSAPALIKMKNAAWLIVFGSLTALAGLFVFRSNPSCISRLVPFARVRVAIETFASGLAFLGDGRSMFLSVAYSLALWLSIALQFWLMVRGMNLEWGFAAATLLMVLAGIGSLVQIPALGGGFQAACYFTMWALFAVPREEAFAKALIAFVASQLPTILVTVLYMPFAGIRLADLRSAAGRIESA